MVLEQVLGKSQVVIERSNHCLPGHRCDEVARGRAVEGGYYSPLPQRHLLLTVPISSTSASQVCDRRMRGRRTASPRPKGLPGTGSVTDLTSAATQLPRGPGPVTCTSEAALWLWEAARPAQSGWARLARVSPELLNRPETPDFNFDVQRSEPKILAPHPMFYKGTCVAFSLPRVCPAPFLLPGRGWRGGRPSWWLRAVPCGACMASLAYSFKAPALAGLLGEFGSPLASASTFIL